ncbi:tryptophan 2,3- dioxygenase [Blastocladiella emersonii ATCC 22665]|nr:tryptophan 2,3- dioxygenase [Blastocladiella emersonii ATCC 22665]
MTTSTNHHPHHYATAAVNAAGPSAPFVPRLEDYDISPITGFIPEAPPLTRLPGTTHEPWERIVDRLQGLLLMDRLRAEVDALPVLPTAEFGDDVRAWRRAALVLALLASAYVWGRHRTVGPGGAASGASSVPTDERDIEENPVLRVLPAAIAVPFAAAAAYLGIRPIVCYACVDLWNWQLLDPTGPVTLSNLATLHTFSGTMDEAWFYLIPVSIEAEGAPALPAMVRGWQAVVDADPDALALELEAMPPLMERMTKVLRAMHARCDPHLFYHQVRPYVAGWALADGGVTYDGVDARRVPRSWFEAHGAPSLPPPLSPTLAPSSGSASAKPAPPATFYFAGGSAAQSSMIQAWDVFLGITHHPTGRGPAAVPTQTPNAPDPAAPAPTNFLTEMREYMPRPHRAFLQDCEARAPKVREFVRRHADSHPRLAAAYDAVVGAVKRFRDAHLQMVARYILLQAKKSAPAPAPAKRPASAAVANGGDDDPMHEPISAKRLRLDLETAVGADAAAITAPPRPTRSMSTTATMAAPDAAAAAASVAARRPRTPSPDAKFTRSTLTDTNGAADPEHGGVRGTGGTQLMPFLKQARDETRMAAVGMPTAGGSSGGGVQDGKARK